MNYKIIKKEKISTTRWRGGTTSELFIYPPDSTYKNRDFGFRISTATVEVDSSEFTPLANVSRTLMVLDGEMALSHKNEHSVLLKKFEQDNFEGGWETSSKGKCTDFNLMCQNGVTGTIDQITSTKNHLIHAQYSHHLFYSYKGPSFYKSSNETILLEEGDVLILTAPFVQSLLCDIPPNSEIICCEIKTNKI